MLIGYEKEKERELVVENMLSRSADLVSAFLFLN